MTTGDAPRGLTDGGAPRRERAWGGAPRRALAIGGRALAIVLLAGALVAMGVHYGSAWEDHADVRTSVGAIEADYGAYVDRPVYLWLTVESASEERIVARSGGGSGAPRVTVTGSDAADSPVGGPVVTSVAAATAGGAALSPGDVIQVYGPLRPDYRVEAERLVVHDGANRLRMLLVSAAGGLLAVAAFLRRWRFDPRRAAFVPREGDDG